MNDWFQADETPYSNEVTDNSKVGPLPSRMRPRSLEEIVGQDHILAPGRLLRRVIESDRFTNLIFYGPPGTGKTTLAEVIAKTTHRRFERTSGVMSNVAQLRAINAEATVGPRYGYYMGWFVTTIYFPGMTSALAWLTARYTLEFIVSVNPAFPLLIPASEGGCLIGPECMALSLFILCGVYAVNTLSPKLAGKLQTSTTVIKLIPLGLMAVVGLIYGLANGMLQQNIAVPAQVQNVSSSPLFTAVCATAFAYEGWIIATSINAEIKDSKKNLPKALILGGIVIVAVYLLYFIGVAGSASNQVLIEKGATVGFTNIFGTVFGNILNLFVAISCLGTTNGLMLGCTRCMYSLAARNEGPAPETFGQIDKKTNMPGNSAVFALLITAAWFLYFYLSNLAGTWKDIFVFDSTELPIITIYLMYIPMLIQWMRKEKDQTLLKRFILPILSLCGSVFMVIACVFSHKIGCLWYLIVFLVVMIIGALIPKRQKKLQ